MRPGGAVIVAGNGQSILTLEGDYYMLKDIYDPGLIDTDYLSNSCYLSQCTVVVFSLRYPLHLVEASLESNDCPGQGVCVPVHYDVPVLRHRGHCDEAGYYRYRTGWYALTVGFTCITPATTQN